MPSPEWCIYYDNGNTFDSNDGPFEDAPPDGVICIARRDGNRTEFLSGGDYYIRYAEDGSIVATEDIGPTLRKLGWLKLGRFTSHKNHARIMARATAEWKAYADTHVVRNEQSGQRPPGGERD